MPTELPIAIENAPILAAVRAARAARRSTGVVLARGLGCCLLVTLAAQVRVPVPGTEVPMTLQLLAVLLTGLSLSPREAAGTLSAYLILGAAGLPVFSPGSTGLFGPTAGYLVGFIPAAWAVSLVRGPRCGGVSRFLGAGALGVAVVFSCGVGWRLAWLNGDWRLALQTGLFPFALKAVIELGLAVALAVAVRRWHQRRSDGKGVSGQVE
jgi:biotin transport system substrate-specific component